MAKGLKISNLNKAIVGEETAVWHNIKLSKATVAHRNIAKLGMDNFTSFNWRGVDAFDVFGAFIINNNNLKFYNGPTYSNSYTKPQFESAYGQLTGITFNIQKIDFTIGVYWISEEHYRYLINWLNPYEINTLSFGFEPDYFYQVKLASVGEGTRYILGQENEKPMYYTEMKLSFEVQGPACAYFRAPYQLNIKNLDDSEDSQYAEYWFNGIQEFSKTSDIALPIECLASIKLVCSDNWNTNTDLDRLIVTLTAQYNNNAPILLFDITFKNQTYSVNPSTANTIDLKYESDSGLLLLNVGDSEYILLNQLSTSNYGKRIVESIIVNKFEIPGKFDDPNFNLLPHSEGDPEVNVDGLKFKITVQGNMGGAGNWIASSSDIHFNVRARTNLI